MNSIGSGLIGYAAGFLTFGLVKSYFMNKSSTKKSEPLKSGVLANVEHSVLNLTPHSINLYDDASNLLFGIKPDEKKMQLRLVSSQVVENEQGCMYGVLSYNYDFDFTKQLETFMKDRNVYSNNIGSGDFVYGKIPMRSPVVYDKVEGIDQLREYLKMDYSGTYSSIVVSMMVAEYLISHKEEFSDLKVHVLVPDSDPKNVVRDTKGAMIGVKGFVSYGKLTE